MEGATPPVPDRFHPRPLAGLPLLTVVISLALAACGDSSVASPEMPEGWEVHESPELGFVMAHPADWEVVNDVEASEVVLTGPDDAEIRVSAYTYDPGWPADRMFQAAEDDAADRYGNPPVVVNELTLSDGARVLVFANDYTDDRGAFFFQRAAVLSPPNMWYVDWYSDLGDEGGDRRSFVLFVRSFVPAPNLGDAEGI
jgi:hypothetical protein